MYKQGSCNPISSVFLASSLVTNWHLHSLFTGQSDISDVGEIGRHNSENQTEDERSEGHAEAGRLAEVLIEGVIADTGTFRQPSAPAVQSRVTLKLAIW